MNYDAIYSDAMAKEDWSRSKEEVFGRDLRYRKKEALGREVKRGFIPTGFPKLDKLVTKLAPVVVYNADEEGDAMYNPADGQISFPDPELYITPEDYARTVLHELSHWTQDHGATRTFRGATLLDEFMGNKLPYAVEEVTAELSVILASETIFGGAIKADYSLHYIRSWLGVTRNTRNEKDPRYIFDLALTNAKAVVELYKNALEE